MLNHVPIGDKAPAAVNVVIEIPAGSVNKFEYDEVIDAIVLDRVQPTAMAQPYDYGFIPETRSEDGDHLDALVVIDEALYPGVVVPARPVGLIRMIDGGERDEKIVCVATNDVNFQHVENLEDLSPHFKDKIKHYFEHYKDLQNKKVEISGWGDAKQAAEIIEEAIAAYKAE